MSRIIQSYNEAWRDLVGQQMICWSKQIHALSLINCVCIKTASKCLTAFLRVTPPPPTPSPKTHWHFFVQKQSTLQCCRSQWPVCFWMSLHWNSRDAYTILPENPGGRGGAGREESLLIFLWVGTKMFGEPTSNKIIIRPSAFFLP